MIETIRMACTTLSWIVCLGAAWSLYRQSCYLYFGLVLVAKAVDQAGATIQGYFILPVVPETVVALAAFLAHPGLHTGFCLAYFVGFWTMAYRNWWWMVKIGLRKDKAELTALVRKVLYHQFDYHGGAVTKFAPATTPTRPEPGQVLVVRTARHRGELLAVQPAVNLDRGQPATGEVTVILDPSVTYQTCTGFGGAFTESSAELLQKMSSAQQEQIVDAYFKEGAGIGYKVGRVHMNSCDFSRGDWSCCEKAGDKELKSFSIEHYKEAILPMVKRAAKAAGKPLTLLASPWSPPAWMKDTGRMKTGGKLKEDCREAWAKHYVAFAKALKDAGFPLWGFTAQNEPNCTTGWENCLYSAEEERDFIRDHLGPALEQSGMDLKLLAWDHNRDDLLQRALVIEKDPAAAKYVHGYGWHWYGDLRYDWWADANDQSCFENVRRVHELCPEKRLWITEVCQELGSHIGDWGVAERYAETLIRDFGNGCEAFVDWNLILDQDGGPNHNQNCCSAPVLVDPAKDRVLFQPSFYYIGHFSRYIKPGAKRILSSTSRAGLEVLAFANPDESVAAVVLNETEYGTWFCLSCIGRLVRWFSEPRTILTFVLHGSDLQAARPAAESPEAAEASEQPSE